MQIRETSWRKSWANRRVSRRLVAVRVELEAARSELAMLSEQALFLETDAEEAEVDEVMHNAAGQAAVARHARGHVERFERAIARERARIAALEQAQNELLAKLVV